jgi:hypothetical protein
MMIVSELLNRNAMPPIHYSHLPQYQSRRDSRFICVDHTRRLCFPYGCIDANWLAFASQLALFGSRAELMLCGRVTFLGSA